MFKKYVALTRYFRRQPFNVATLDGMREERYRMAAWAALANFVNTAMGMLAVVITVPMTLPYLGEERFGVWMTVSSIAGVLSFLDFGIGNGLINRVAAVNAQRDAPQLRFAISHGLIVLSVISLVIALALYPLAAALPWERIIKVSNPETVLETHKTIAIFVLIFAASIPINGIQKIFQGMQRAWQAHLCRALGSILSLLLVYVLSLRRAGVPELLLASYGVQTGVPLVLMWILWKNKLIGLPAFQWLTWSEETRLLIKSGGLFFLLQIGTLIGWEADSLIIASTLGAVAVTKYTLIQRLFQFVVVPLCIINAPLWGAYADAQARGDKAFITHTLKTSLVYTAAAALLGCLVLAAFAPEIFDVWLKGATDIPLQVVLVYGVWAVISAIGTAFGIFLNGVGEIKSQVITVVLFCVAALPLKFLMVSSYGLIGLIGVSILAYLATVVLPYVFIFNAAVKRHLRFPANFGYLE